VVERADRRMRRRIGLRICDFSIDRRNGVWDDCLRVRSRRIVLISRRVRSPFQPATSTVCVPFRHGTGGLVLVRESVP